MPKFALVVIHALPLVPLWFERYYGFVAAVLLVALPYIKAKKFSVKLAQVNEHPESPKKRDELKALSDLEAFWRGFTFLS